MKTQYLNYIDRIPSINKEIDYVYNKISSDTSSSWRLYNGKESYRNANVNEQYLIEKLILDNQEQKEFYIVEVGAGNFQFGQSLTRFINKKIADKIIPNDITINIISIRGESATSLELNISGNCQIYELGNFKIENFIKELQAKGLNEVIGKVDFMISQYCLRHLVDPLGTFLQMHDCLKKTGLLLTDTFDFAVAVNENDKVNSNFGDTITGTSIILSYLKNAGDMALVRTGYDERGYPRIVVKKLAENIDMPFKYDITKYDNDTSSYKQILNSTEKPLSYMNELVSEAIYYKNSGKFIGDRELFIFTCEGLLLEAKDKLNQWIEEISNTEDLETKYNEDDWNQECYENFTNYQKSFEEKIEELKRQIISIKDCINGVADIYNYQYGSCGLMREFTMPETSSLIGLAEDVLTVDN